MRATVSLILFCFCTVSWAAEVKRPRLVEVPIPECEKHILNLTGFLHEPLRNRPSDDLRTRGRVAVGAPVTWQTLERTASLARFVMGTDHKGAYIVQPRHRALMNLPGFRDRIPTRDLRYIRQLKASGFTVTFDRAFERVLEGCATATRRNRDNMVDIPAPNWISPDLRNAFVKMHFHPDQLARSVEVWFNGHLVGGLFFQFVNGVPMGESMFFDRAVGNNIGKLALYALLERLEADGHPRLDVQTLDPELSLPYRWGAYLEDRDRHELLHGAHQRLNLKFDSPSEPGTPSPIDSDTDDRD